MQAKLSKEESVSRASFCCTMKNSSSSTGISSRARDSIFNYDISLLNQEETVLDLPWISTIDLKDIRNEKKNRKEEEEDLEHARSRRSIFNECSRNPVTRSLCGVICNPLLSSRFALMGLLALLLILMTVFTWVLTTTNIEHSVSSIALKFRSELLSRTGDRVNSVLQGSNASATSLARLLGRIIDKGNTSSLSFIQNQVEPALFLTFSILLRRARVTFFGANGLFRSYVPDATGVRLLYANTSYLIPNSSGNSSTPLSEAPWKEGENLTVTRPWYRWYYQKVDEISGALTGEAMPITPIPYWDSLPLKNVLEGQNTSASWGPSPIDISDISFSFFSPIQRNSGQIPMGAVSIGVSMVDMVSVINQFELPGGAVYLSTSDGELVAQTGATPLSFRRNSSVSVFGAVNSNNPIVAGAAQHLVPYIPAILAMTNQSFTAANVDIHGTRYMINSAPLHLAEATLVCTVIVPYHSIWGMSEKRGRVTLAVLVALGACMGLVGFFFIVLLTKGIGNEMRLRASLIQQIEETKRAESKSNHKSLVFANMSHDLRTPLAAILGLIDLCLCDATELSELESNLIQMKSCATNLLGILNSILDMSKIEAGKLLLQESGFDLVRALEEVVDTFSVLGLKKGVEVVLDMSDSFVEKASWIIGDGGRVKQIIANLLSNGVKFTSEGHVVLRAWVKPFDVSNARHQGRLTAWPWNQILRSPSREKDLHKLIQGLPQHEHDDGYLQVEFEVDDSGRGIPKERWKSVFENFVQVESSGPRIYDGTGLGLGIVRSLVRLMGGEINIIDKDEPGEPGTRFRFNLIVRSGKNPDARQSDGSAAKGSRSHNEASFEYSFGAGGGNGAISPQWQLDSSGPFALNSQGLELAGFHTPPAAECVNVLLAMHGRAGERVVKSWMERRGLQVCSVESWDELSPIVGRMKIDMLSESESSSERPGYRSPESRIYDSWAEEELDRGGIISRAPIAAEACHCGIERMRISDAARSHKMMTTTTTMSHRASQAYLLVIADVAMATGAVSDLCSELEDMLMDADFAAAFRVVWLVNVDTPSSDIQFLRRQTHVCHLILHKPLYASRLNRVWVLLQELAAGNAFEPRSFEEAEPSHLHSGNCETIDLSASNSLYKSLSCMSTFQGVIDLPSDLAAGARTESLVDEKNGAGSSASLPGMAAHGGKPQQPLDPAESSKEAGSKDNNYTESSTRGVDCLSALRDKSRLALSAMHILVAEDNLILQRLTTTQLTRLGARVECVDNGAEAVRVVLENLYKSQSSSPLELLEDAPKRHLFDLVLMDCEMPILNGYDATQRIRSEETRYGVRTPVIALTAHAMAQDEKKCIEAGMDFYLTKPLSIDVLLDVVTKLLSRSNAEVVT